jgi:hypothetical protein
MRFKFNQWNHLGDASWRELKKGTPWVIDLLDEGAAFMKNLDKRLRLRSPILAQATAPDEAIAQKEDNVNFSEEEDFLRSNEEVDKPLLSWKHHSNTNVSSPMKTHFVMASAKPKAAKNILCHKTL